MKVELYASGPVDNTPEAEFLRELIVQLGVSRRAALVVSQPKLAGVTPDFLVAMEVGAWTVDVKTITGSLHGNLRDAKWRRKIAGEKRKPYPNLLTAMKAHREALMDDMRAGAKVMGAPIHEIKWHVTAIAAVWPKLPVGSDCDRTPDLHAGYLVADADEAIARIAHSALKPAWSPHEWRRFIVEHLRAIPVKTVDELCDPQLFEAVLCAGTYREEFLQCFGSQRESFSPHPEFFEKLKAMVALDGALLVHGGSGSGKTIHLEACASALAEAGALPVFASAEVYDGSLERLQAIGSAGYAPANAAELLSYLPRLAAQRRILFVDGLDSVAEEHRRTLLSQVADQVERGLWSLVVLSAKMENPDVDARLPLRKLASPSMEGGHREAVFQSHLRGRPRTPWQERLLEVTLDGFAVRALALAEGVRDGASLSEAIASYIRSLLPQDHALVAMQIARAVAREMENRFAQSIVVDEFDGIATEICRKEGVGLSLGDSVRRSRLFRQQGARIRIQHERIQVFLGAQALDEGTSDEAALLAKLNQPRHSEYAQIMVGFPKHRSLEFLISVWSMLNEERLVRALVAGEFSRQLREEGIQAVEEFLDGYCTHLKSHAHVIQFVERGEGVKPQPVLTEDNAFIPSQPKEKFILRMLLCAGVITEFKERIADVVLLEEQSLLQAAGAHARSPRGCRQIVRKVVAAEGVLPNRTMLLLRDFHREWNLRLDDGMLKAIGLIVSRGGMMMEITSLQAKLATPLGPDEASEILSRWATLMEQSGFRAGRVLERHSDRMLFRNWNSLIDAHRKGGEFKVLLEKLVNEGMDTTFVWHDTMLRFAAEIGVIVEESLESQTARFLSGLRATSTSFGENNTAAIASGKRRLFDRAVELNEWEAWTAAWSQLSEMEKRTFARDAIPPCGLDHNGMLESMLIDFLMMETWIEPADLIGVFRTRPWERVIFGIGDVAACHLELAAYWGALGKPLPNDAFADADFTENDCAAWPAFVSLVHAVARSAMDDARIMLNGLLSEHPLVLPTLLTIVMERQLEGKLLKRVSDDLLREFRMELARASAMTCERIEELRCAIQREHFNKAQTVALIFRLCVNGGTETRAAVVRHVESPVYGRLAVAAMRAGAT